MNLKKCLIAFDFDGVIWDSVDECFYLGRRAFEELFGEISGDEDYLLSQFRKARYLAKSGSDFHIVFHLLKTAPYEDFDKYDKEEFRKHRITYRENIEIFTKFFYDKRQWMIRNQPELWLKGQGPYDLIREQLPLIEEESAGIVICSAKDRQSIRFLLHRYNLNYDIYSREISTCKPDLLNRIITDKSADPHRIIFIDDLMENLTAVKAMGVNVLMAGWGYNNESERVRAKTSGIGVLYKENLLSQLKTFCANQP